MKLKSLLLMPWHIESEKNGVWQKVVEGHLHRSLLLQRFTVYGDE
jgi:hypothetical protein